MNILIVEARYHPDVADALVDGATAALEKGGARFERMSVPGVLEIPAAIAIARAFARSPLTAMSRWAAVTGPAHIAEMFYAETMRGLMALSASGMALGQGIVLAGDEGAALDLAVTHDIGGDAARACLALITFGRAAGDACRMSSKQSDARSRGAPCRPSGRGAGALPDGNVGRRRRGSGARNSSSIAFARTAGGAGRGIFHRHRQRRAAASGGDRPHHRRRAVGELEAGAGGFHPARHPALRACSSWWPAATCRPRW